MGYSVDLREKVVEYYNECKNITKTCNTFKIARSTLYSWITLHKENGNLKPKVRTEHTTKIDYDKLKNLVEKKPDAFLREYAAYFGVTTVAIWSVLKRLKITRKKKTTTYKEANPKKKVAFNKCIKAIAPKLLVYLDESGVNKCLYREYGRAPIGTKIVDTVSTTQIENRIIALMIVKGTCNTDIFNTWLNKGLIPELTPGQIIIMDNASFHKSARTRELIESAECRVLYLPPYSPDLNPIEQTWANIKRKIRNLLEESKNLSTAIDRAFKTVSV